MTRISPKVMASPIDVRRIMELRLNPLNRVVINCSIDKFSFRKKFISFGISVFIPKLIILIPNLLIDFVYKVIKN